IYIYVAGTWMVIRDVPMARQGTRSTGYGLIGEPAKPRRPRYCRDIPVDSTKAVKAIAALVKTDITSPMFLEPAGIDYMLRVCSSSPAALERSWRRAREVLEKIRAIPGA
ncbi:MAG: hypothetical protein QI199_07660, partial [Candidatus Korarchaeota archaeon]|nr:hypothetical protein [Candidatus Korarchaeota archaeon]